MSKNIQLEPSNGDGYNPIERIEIILSQLGATVALDELSNGAGGEANEMGTFNLGP